MDIKQKEEDDEHARQVAKEGMVGTEDLYDLKAQENAATKLEAIARGKRDRKMVKHMKEEKAKMKEKEAQEEKEASEAAAQAEEKGEEDGVDL